MFVVLRQMMDDFHHTNVGRLETVPKCPGCFSRAWKRNCFMIIWVALN